MTKGPQA